MIHRASAAILAGGESRRMGYNKAFITMGKKTLLEIIISKLSVAFPVVLLVTNNPQLYSHLHLPIVSNIYKRCGPLAGIHAALLESQTPYVFVTACDMPFMDVRLAMYLVEQSSGYDVVIPRIQGFTEPLFALYGKRCLPVIASNLACGINKIASFFPKVRVKYVEQEEIIKFSDPGKIFVNVNTPEDLQMVKKYLGAGP